REHGAIEPDERAPERRIAGSRHVAGRLQRHRPALVAVVVERQRLAGVSGRTRDALRYAVERDRAGPENDRAVEDGRDAADAALHARVPQLEPAAIGLLPVAVEEQDQVELAAPGTALGVRERIGVDVQVAARLGAVKAG